MGNTFEFFSKNSCKDKIAEFMADSTLDRETISTVAELMVDQFSQSSTTSETSAGMAARFGRWVIRDEDIGFFNVLKNGLSLGAALSIGGSPAAPFVGVIAALCQTSWNIYRNGVSLTPLQIRVLAELEKEKNGMSVNKITAQISVQEAKISNAEVEKVLEELDRIPARSGLKSVVSKYKGLWRVAH